MLFLSLSNVFSILIYPEPCLVLSLSCFVPFILSCPIYYGFCSLFCLVLSVMFCPVFPSFPLFLSCPLCNELSSFSFLFSLFCLVLSVCFMSSFFFLFYLFCIVLSVMFCPLYPSFLLFIVLSSL